jgi:hypothetical protein
MTGRVRKLRDMEIDEISLVDRAANQHASILFSKSQEDAMPGYEEGVELYDSNGDPADFEDLEVGDLAYDADGNEYVMVEDDGSDQDEFDGYYEEELEAVGKSGGKREALQAGYQVGRGKWSADVAELMRRQAGYKTVKNGKTTGHDRSRLMRAGEFAGRNRNTIASVPVAAGAGYGANELRKSLGDVLVEELSKSDRDERTLKMAATMGDEIEKAQAQAAEAIAYAEQLHEERALEAFVSKAAEYNLPVDPFVLGEILKSAAQVLDRDQLDVLDELFTAMGDEIFDEIGALGDTDNSDVLMQVDAYADELVGKSQGGVSHAEASTMLFEANPEAYELYLRENGGF